MKTEIRNYIKKYGITDNMVIDDIVNQCFMNLEEIRDVRAYAYRRATELVIEHKRNYAKV